MTAIASSQCLTYRAEERLGNTNISASSNPSLGMDVCSGSESV